MLPVEKWRRDNGITISALANMLGCSRQYVKAICNTGTKGVEKAIRLISISNGELTIEDLLKPEDKQLLIDEGFLKPQDEVSGGDSMFDI